MPSKTCSWKVHHKAGNGIQVEMRIVMVSGVKISGLQPSGEDLIQAWRIWRCLWTRESRRSSEASPRDFAKRPPRGNLQCLDDVGTQRSHFLDVSHKT